MRCWIRWWFFTFPNLKASFRLHAASPDEYRPVQSTRKNLAESHSISFVASISESASSISSQQGIPRSRGWGSFSSGPDSVLCVLCVRMENAMGFRKNESFDDDQTRTSRQRHLSKLELFFFEHSEDNSFSKKHGETNFFYVRE